MAEWKECTISEIGTVVGGATPSTKNPENYEGGTIAWITPKDLSTFKGRYISYGERQISQKGLESCSAQLLPKNTVLFSSRAPIGYVAIAQNEVCTNQGFKSVIPNHDTDPLFLFYLLKYNKDNIENMGSGTTFKEISGNTMKSVKVKVPSDYEEQKKIASILGALDDKIEENQRINNNLRQICLINCQHLIKTNSPNGCVGDLIVESPKSKIKVGDAKNIQGPYPFFTSGQAILEYDSPLVEGRNIYLNTGGNADVKYYIGSAAYSTDTWCIHGADNLTDYLYLVLLNMLNEINETCFEGSTLKHLQKQKLRNKEIYIPNKNTDFLVLSEIGSNLNIISHNQRENKTLAKLRDALLPKLMSGELNVSDIQF